MQSRRRSKLPRYRVIGGIPSVELKLKTPRQLFDERDPAPFRERDLDDDAAEYIVSSVRELKDQGDVRLSLYFESLGEFENKPSDIARAIHQFFAYEADRKRRELKETFHHGLISLAIGMTFLSLCVWFAHGIEKENASLFQWFTYEGLMLMGWVSMWKPINTFLYEWWPIAEDVKTFKRLAIMDVEIAPLKPSVVAPTAAPIQAVSAPVAAPAPSPSVAMAITTLPWQGVPKRAVVAQAE